ncbi:transcription termination factor MTERF2, chloroplastic isoform X1 [Vigna umbellata]|uniref:transcription termination factor MTERF2, chloroplastic isoform X1 n=1 Tax=Vigna umbellata TaxID=87088 RepID=UPI001F5FB4AE|nr:transcription termination factor MTERF2, chloroplastic isoform X1 [Vigna umbellata]
MLVKIQTNWFVPVAVPFSVPHKLEGCFVMSKCVLSTHTPTLFEVDNDKARRRRRRSNWSCGCGSEEANVQRQDLSESESKRELEVQEARRAISSYLGELGVSEEESLSIAWNCPGYVKMLVEGVRDLDEWGWETDEEIEGLSFKDKILRVAAQKGDKGKIAYLETLGLTLSWSINVAGYLSAHTLPSLIHKVTRIKQLFFSPPDNDGDHHPSLLMRNILLTMRHLSISIDEDLQRTFSFFEKLQAKPGGLNILASQDSAFSSLIQSFPRMLHLSLDNHLTLILDSLLNFGIPTSRISRIILAFPPLLFWNLQILQTRLLAVKQINVADQDYAKFLLKYPWFLSTSIQENYAELLAFSYSIKVPKTQIDRAIESHPHLLSCSTSKLELMVDQFAKLGVRKKKLSQVITRSPQLLLRKPKDFLQIVLLFENMDLDKETIGRILARCPEIFASSINKTLQRKIEFLGRVGICKAFLPGVIRKYPELLVSDIDKTLLLRIIYLMKLGLSEEEIAFMVRTFSPLLGYSIEGVLKPKIEFLVNSMERPVRDVVSYPRYFSYSLEKKIKPRYWVLKRRDIKCSLKDMLGKNDEEFAAEFMGIGGMPVSHPVSSNDSL